MSPRPQDLPHSDPFAPALRLARQGRCDEAIAAVREALGDRAGDPALAGAAANALARIAWIAEADERWGEAERAIAAGLALGPRYPDLHQHHARLLLLRGRRAEAREALDRALAIHPRFVAARVDRALLDAREGRIGDALQALRALASEHRLGESPGFERGLERLREADVAEAGVLLSRALQITDPVLQEHLETIRKLLEDGEIPRAAQRIRELLPRYERYPDLHYLMGLAELRTVSPDDALASFARALELHPDFHAARIQLALALHALGQGTQAADQLRSVLEADPGQAQARELLERWTARAVRA